MKKVVLILLISVYSFATMGFSLKEFYCCGKLKSISLSVAEYSSQKCDKGDGKGCCDNKYQYFKVKDNHISSKEIASPPHDFTSLPLNNTSLSFVAFAVQVNTTANSTHAPPLSSGVPSYIYNCVFRV